MPCWFRPFIHSGAARDIAIGSNHAPPVPGWKKARILLSSAWDQMRAQLQYQGTEKGAQYKEGDRAMLRVRVARGPDQVHVPHRTVKKTKIVLLHHDSFET